MAQRDDEWERAGKRIREERAAKRSASARTSSMRTLFEIRAHRRTWSLVLAVIGFAASWLAARHLLQ